MKKFLQKFESNLDKNVERCEKVIETTFVITGFIAVILVIIGIIFAG